MKKESSYLHMKKESSHLHMKSQKKGYLPKKSRLQKP